MSNHRDVLTERFLQAHGVAAHKPLRDWLTRVSFLARSQASDAMRERYERWALHVVEEAAKAPGGVTAVSWAKQATVMPPNAPDRVSAWWQESRQHATASSSNGVAINGPDATRTALLDETVKRAPGPLKPFVLQGFSLYDREVALGRRTYHQVTFVEMLNIAKSLQAKAASPAPAAVSAAVSAAPAPAPAPVAAPPAAAAAPLPQRAAANSAAARPAAVKRAPVEKAPYEPAPKRAAATTEVATLPRDKTFFFQLAGIREADVAAPPVFVGTSTELERNYTRYEPLVEDIRPLTVLKDAYAHIAARASAMEAAESKKAAQKYLSDQLKGMRQDLRVQNIVDDFTVMVYEVHARLCLAMGDIGEFNQCQAGLRQFYTMDAVDLARCDVRSFFLYRLVYLTLSGQYDSLSTEVIHFTNGQLQGTDRVGRHIDRETVNRALALCAACNTGDTPSLCRLLLGFEVEMAYLVRIYLQKLRIMWLKEILTAMKGSLTLRFLMASLGFAPLQHGKKKRRQFWLDEDEAGAALCFAELFATLKVELPADFSFHAEVTRTKHTNPAQAHAANPSLDAATALKAVNDYVVFLGTRKDAGIG